MLTQAGVGSLSEGELAQRIAGGSPPARAEEAELCRRFGPRLTLYGLRHLGSAAAAADLAQRVLELTLEKLRGGAVRDPQRIASFVLGTARRVAAEASRQEKRVLPLGEEDAAAGATGGEGGVSMDAAWLARCLEALSERERSVVVLTWYADRKASEIASDLALSEGNVRVIRHRAVVRLRACMGLGDST